MAIIQPASSRFGGPLRLLVGFVLGMGVAVLVAISMEGPSTSANLAVPVEHEGVKTSAPLAAPHEDVEVTAASAATYADDAVAANATRQELAQAIKWEVKEVKLLAARVKELQEQLEDAAAPTTTTAAPAISPTPPTPPASSSLPGNLKCTEIPTTDAARWRLEKCGVEALSPVFRLTELQCKDTQATLATVSKSAATRAAAAALGPSEIWANLEGAELMPLGTGAVGFHYRGSCVYDLGAKVTIPGRYRLMIVVQRTGYAAVRESGGWPIIHYDLPVGDDHFITLGNPAGTQNALDEVRTKPLPRCSLTDPSHAAGRWVTRIPSPTPEDVFRVFNPRGRKFVEAPLTGENHGAPMKLFVDQGDFVWTPYRCRLREFAPGKDVCNCLSNKIVHVMGDSHARLFGKTLYEACTVPRLPAYDKRHRHEWGSLECIPTGSGKVCFHEDPLGSVKTVVKPTPNFSTYVVANFGQHPASNLHWPLDKYNSSVYDKLAWAAEQPVEWLWHETNSPPMRMDSWVIGFKDWRTTARLALYNNEATMAARYFGAPVMSTFQQTMPLAQQLNDNAHNQVRPLYFGPLQQLLNHICPQ